MSTKKKKSKKSKSVRYGDWVQKLDPNSKRYYYGNVKTLERVWEMPEEFQVAEAEAASKATSSSKASTKEAAAPSTDSPMTTAITTSPDSNNTATTREAVNGEAGGEEEWLEGYDPKNKRKYYVNKRTGESRWTKPLAKEEVNANDWISGRDPKTKRVYYYNKRTKETTWEKPPGYRDPGEEKESANTTDAQKVIAATNNRKKTIKPIIKSVDGAQSRVDSPSLKELKDRKKQQKTKKKRPPEAGKSGTMLWISGTDPNTGKVYYYNTATKETTWTKPSENALQVKSKHHRKESSETMDEVQKSVQKGIVKARRSSLVKEAEQSSSSRSGHSRHIRQRSRADSAVEVIRKAQLARLSSTVEEEAAAANESNTSQQHGRQSSVDDLLHSDMIMTSSSLDNVPRSNNTVEIFYLQLLSQTTKGLSTILHGHRKRLGGLSTAPLSDIIEALNEKSGDGDSFMTPYMDGDSIEHRRTISNLELSPGR